MTTTNTTPDPIDPNILAAMNNPAWVTFNGVLCYAAPAREIPLSDRLVTFSMGPAEDPTFTIYAIAAVKP